MTTKCFHGLSLDCMSFGANCKEDGLHSLTPPPPPGQTPPPTPPPVKHTPEGWWVRGQKKKFIYLKIGLNFWPLE